MTELNKNIRQWYLVYTKPKQEGVACEQLERQGYSTYLPMVMAAKRRNGRRYYIKEPLFPRYLFIHLDQSTDNWAPIRSSIGVSNLVRFGMQPAPLDEAIIEHIRSRENNEGLHEVAEELTSGNKIRVLDGPMMGLEGIFVAKSGEQRVMLLLDIMGKTARVKMDVDAIEVVG